MSCESYVRKRTVFEVGFKKGRSKDAGQQEFKDDHELLAYLLYQEQLAENHEPVSFESVTSD